MSARAFLRGWNEFFFKPQPTSPMGLYRIIFGLLVLANVILLAPDWQTWFGPHSFMTRATMYRVGTGTRINLFTLIPDTETAVFALFWVFLVACIFVTIGFMTRLSSIVMYVCLTSINQRNFYILHSGDALMRSCGFFLMFAPAGASMSVDRLLRIWRGKEGVEVPYRSPWAQRLIQIQVSLVYFSTFYWKTLGTKWLNGTAFYYSMHLQEFHRFWVPDIENQSIMKVFTWLTLLIEFSAGILVWFKELRYFVLALAACLQLSIEYSMNIPLFEWTIMATYILFIYPEDFTNAWVWIRQRYAARLGEPVNVVFDSAWRPSANAAKVLQTIDIFGRLHFIDLRSGEARTAFPDLTVATGRNRVLFASGAGFREGFAGLISIARRVPLLWPLAPLALFQGAPKQALSAIEAAK